MRRRSTTILVLVSLLAACGSAGSTAGSVADDDEGVATTSASATTATTARTTTEPPTTDAPTTDAPTTDPVPSVPDIDVLEDAERTWASPVQLGSFDLSLVAGFAPGRGLLAFEDTGGTVDGCEADTDPERRLVLVDADGERRVLLDPAAPRDGKIGAGPDGRVAVVAYCDANAWLSAVGILDDSGLHLTRLPDLPEDRRSANGNDLVRLAWSPDGATLFFNGTPVDANVGSLLDPDTSSSQSQVLAQTSSGSHLVVEAGEMWHEVHLVPAGSTLERTPILFEVSVYPSPDVSVAADGSRIAVAIEDWEDPARQRTVVVADDAEPVTVAGLGTLSPNGRWLLVDSTDGWRLVDLDTMTTSTVPLPGDLAEPVEAAWFDDSTIWAWNAPNYGEPLVAVVSLSVG